ncbi:MAG: FAD-dependent oxidoreductase [Spirochaetales bacterium]|nr:FAD-dependent oxidoreductase [Spirochaetales bacterium]
MKKNTGKLVAVMLLTMTILISTGCSKKETQAEVIVVGSGLSGHAAAYSALENGAKVLWIEKQEKLGGSAVIATGTFSAAGTEIQKAKGIEDSVDLFIEDLNRIGKGKADQDLLKVYAEKADDVWAWFIEKGLVPSEKSPFIDPVHTPYSVARTSTPEKNSAFEYCKVLQNEMENYKKSLTVMTSTEVVELLIEKGAVTGVKTANGKEFYSDAVILCTGGYGSNFDFIAERMPKYKEIRSVTMPHTDGKGIIMAEKAGAAIINMDYMVGYFGAIAQEGTKQASFGTLTSGFADRWKGDIWVDINGNRFINEDASDEDPRETAIDSIPEQTSFIIFDQAAIDAAGGKVPVRDFEKWIATDYGVKKSDSLEKLAESFDLPVANFLKTIDGVNEAAKTGIDKDFGKEVNMPISTAPFYGIKAYGTTFMTQGGIKTTTDMQAVTSDGKPIEGLYAAGEVQGTAQWGGFGYAGGSGNSPALIFGFEAGRHAAASSIK